MLSFDFCGIIAAYEPRFVRAHAQSLVHMHEVLVLPFGASAFRLDVLALLGVSASTVHAHGF